MNDKSIKGILSKSIVAKVCRECKETKSIEDFYNVKNGKYGKGTICKKCSSIKCKEWRNKNPSYNANNAKKWRINNPEKYKEKYKNLNRSEEQRVASKKYYKKNKNKRHKLSIDWRNNNPEKWAMIQRNGQLKRLYGINHSDYLKILSTQNGKCKICGRDNPDGRGKYFHVDHCHDTGNIRGVLCFSCNFALGMAEDNIKIIENAILYLEKHNGNE